MIYFCGGTLQLLNVASILDSSEDTGNDELLERAMLTTYHIKVEPRLTCVTCWADGGAQLKNKSGENIARS